MNVELVVFDLLFFRDRFSHVYIPHLLSVVCASNLKLGQDLLRVSGLFLNGGHAVPGAKQALCNYSGL